MRKIINSARVLVVALLAMGAVAIGVPAFAQGTPQDGPVTATVTVQNQLTLTLSTSSISFGTGAAGQTLGSTSGGDPSTEVTANVTCYDVKGYQLSASATDFSAQVPASSLSVGVMQGGSWQAAQPMNETNGVTLVTTNDTSPSPGDNDQTSWALNLPASAANGAEQSTITFMAVAQ
jgi:hypothetical protein